MGAVSHADVEARVKRLLVSELNVRPALVDTATAATALLREGIGLDSVEAVTLACAVEVEFSIRITDDDMTADLFQDLGSFSNYVRGALERGALAR